MIWDSHPYAGGKTWDDKKPSDQTPGLAREGEQGREIKTKAKHISTKLRFASYCVALFLPRMYQCVMRLVLGPWSLVPGSWSLIFGPWSLVFGLWSLVLDPWSLVLGLWPLALGLCSLVFGVLVPGPWQ